MGIHLNQVMAADEHPRLIVDGYGRLTSRQILRQLERLTEAELRALRRHEAAHKNRRTLLRAIDSLLEPQSH
ncbi:MAG TPA: hypothetical protein VF980_09895 [Thermoanaerobaculia bacterium]